MVKITKAMDDYFTGMGKEHMKGAMVGALMFQLSPKTRIIVDNYTKCCERAVDRQQGKEIPEIEMPDDDFKALSGFVVGFSDDGKELLMYGSHTNKDLPQEALDALTNPDERIIVLAAYAHSRAVGVRARAAGLL